jgi:hypothetical protein
MRRQSEPRTDWTGFNALPADGERRQDYDSRERIDRFIKGLWIAFIIAMIGGFGTLGIQYYTIKKLGDNAREAKALAKAIQNTRVENIVRDCELANERHNRLTKLVDKNARGRNVDATLVFINIIAPKRKDCDAYAKRRVALPKSGPQG